jgi:hypothetical protein
VEVAAHVTALEQATVSGERVSKIEKVATSFEDWQPAVEGSLDDVKLEIRKLNKHLERVVLDHAPIKSDGIFGPPESASARPSA